MIQSMMTQLAGYEPLQNKILMYCLGSPSAVIMKPLCARVETKRQEQELSEDEVTAWRYYNKNFRNFTQYGIRKSPNSFGSFLGLCVIEELRIIKEQDPILKEEGTREVKRLFNRMNEIKQLELTVKEKNGTPTGIIVRKYMTNLFNKGLILMENETMWARFSSGGQLLTRQGNPLVELLQPEVKGDLTRALNELKAQYKKNRKLARI